MRRALCSKFGKQNQCNGRAEKLQGIGQSEPTEFPNGDNVIQKIVIWDSLITVETRSNTSEGVPTQAFADSGAEMAVYPKKLAEAKGKRKNGTFLRTLSQGTGGRWDR